MHILKNAAGRFPNLGNQGKRKNSFFGEETEGLGEPGRAGVVLPPPHTSRTQNYSVYKVPKVTKPQKFSGQILTALLR